MVSRGWLLIAELALVGVLSAFGFASDGFAYATTYTVSLTATGPAPSLLKIGAGAFMEFHNKDSVAHTVVFANGRCTVSVPPGYWIGPGGQSVYPGQQVVPQPGCNDNFPFYVGSYAYSVDGKFSGAVETRPLRRFVTLEARTHRVARGSRLTLHGEVIWGTQDGIFVTRTPFPVIVVARYEGQRTFEPLATVAVRYVGGRNGGFRWQLSVRPGVTTSYLAEVTGQLPEGQVWTKARSRLLTVRMGR